MPRLKLSKSLALSIMLVMFLYISIKMYISVNVPSQQEDELKLEKARSSLDGSRIMVDDHYSLTFSISGHHFNSKGIHKSYEHHLVSSIIHTFSPYTENRFKEMILDPRNEQRVYANSPAIMWHKGEIICIMRIWLEKEIYSSGRAKKPENEIGDNFLYHQKFDQKMRPLTPGSILGLPTPRQWLIGDGPIEPRLFKVDEENVFVSFNTGVIMQDGTPLDGTFLWDYIRHKTLIPSIKGGAPIIKNVQPGAMPRDKHWTPYIDEHQLKMVYNLDPLRVLTCSLNFSCDFSHFEGPQNYQFQQYKDTLRGGTPWVLYRYPYYYSVGHSTLFKDPSENRIYTNNLIVYKASPTPRVVYLSGPIQIHDKPMHDIPIVRREYITDPFFFPVSILEEHDDSMVIGGHINDYSAVLLRVTGIKKILDDVIAEDRAFSDDMAGPTVGTLHSSTKTFATVATKAKFFT